MPKLSVIVPFRDVRRYAPDALRSLRANARPDFEFVLVDDGSRDDTPDLVERTAEKLSRVARVRFLRRERPGGIAAARNAGLDAAEGEYLTFLDGDDWYAPGYLPQLVAAAEGLSCDFLRTDHVRVTGRARTVRRVPVGLRDEVLDPREVILPADRTTAVDYPQAWAGVYHRRLLERGLLHFPDGLRTAEDRPWIWRLHRQAGSFAVVGLLGVFYRKGVASSLTRVGDERQLDFVPAFDRVVAETAADRDADRLLPKAVRTYCAVIDRHLAERDKFAPAVAARLRAVCGDALRRLPRDVLDEVLDSMDAARAARLQPAAESAAACGEGGGVNSARTRIYCATSPSAVVLMAAAVEAGLVPGTGRRMLLVCDDAPVPEAAPPWDEVPGFARLRARFDAVLSWNEAIRPFHPAAWTPRAEDVPLLERHLRRLWRLGDDRVELVLGAPDTPPAQALARVFTGAPLHVCAGGPHGLRTHAGEAGPADRHARTAGDAPRPDTRSVAVAAA